MNTRHHRHRYGTREIILSDAFAPLFDLLNDLCEAGEKDDDARLLHQRLRANFRDPDQLGGYLNGPSGLLGGRTPADCIRAGEFSDVLKDLEAYENMQALDDD